MRFRQAAAIIAAASATVAATVSAGVAQAGPSTYRYANARYGFSLQVPSFLRESSPPVDGDGRDFTAPHALLAAYGANNVKDLTASGLQAAQLRHLPRGFHVTYKSRVGAVVTLSGVQPGPRGGTIFYERDVVGAGSIDTLAWSYPAAQRSLYDPLVTQVVRSYRPGNVTESH